MKKEERNWSTRTRMKKKTKWTGDHVSVAIAIGFSLGTAFGVILKATAHPDWETWHLAVIFPIFIFSLHGLWFQIKSRLKRKSKGEGRKT